MNSFKALAIGAIACFGSIVVSGTDRSASAQKISIGLSSIDALYGPWFYARDKGYFSKHGLDVTLNFLESGTRCVQALVGASIDMCAADGSAMMNAIFAGSDITYVGATFNVVAADIYGNRNVSAPSMIKGGRWAISTFGAESHMVARVTLKHFKIDEKDVTIVQLGGQSTRLAALDTGQAQVTSLAPPANFRAATMGLNRLVKLGDLGLEYLSVGPAVSKRYLQQNRASIKRFLQSLAEATVAYKKDRAGSAEVLQKALNITDRKIAEDSWDYFAHYHDHKLRITAKSFEIPLRYSDNPKAATAKVSDFSDQSLLDELEKEGFFGKLN